MIKNNSHQEGAIQNHEVEMPYFVERSKGISKKGGNLQKKLQPLVRMITILILKSDQRNQATMVVFLQISSKQGNNVHYYSRRRRHPS